MLAVHVGKGYREVQRGECIEPSDQYWSPKDDAWLTVGAHLLPVSAFVRRSVAPPIAMYTYSPRYQLLQLGDLIESGDEAYDKDTREWSPVTQPGGYISTFSKLVRRPLPDPAEQPSWKDPYAAGYRILQLGEKTEKGDEYFSLTDRQWKPAATNVTIGQFSALCRRKLASLDEDVPECPAPGYRLLNPDEVIEAGDEYKHPSDKLPPGKEWLLTMRVGSLAGRYYTYRRKVATPEPTQAAIDPGSDYVLLSPGDKLVAGDEFTHDRPPNKINWCRTNCVGSEVLKHETYRRKKPVEKPVEIGEGYHQLDAGTKLVAGDEWYSPKVGWHRTNDVGLPAPAGMTYRRENLQPEAVPALPTKGAIVGRGYVRLKWTDTLQKDDEFWSQHDQAWVVTASPGSPAGHSLVYRRKAPEPQRYTVDPGEGYRLLGPDEPCREGDEWRYTSPEWPEDWYPARSIGSTAYNHFVYRRKLPPKLDADAPGEGYCWVAVGDTLASGDESFSRTAGAWGPIFVPGVPVSLRNTFRRRIPQKAVLHEMYRGQAYTPFTVDTYRGYRDLWCVSRGEAKNPFRINGYSCRGPGSYTWLEAFKRMQFEDGTPFGAPLDYCLSSGNTIS